MNGDPERNPFAPTLVEQPMMMILLVNSGWRWDYWGKFYGPDGIKMRDLDDVLAHIVASWKCDRHGCGCDPGCPCCSPGNCRTEGEGYIDVPPPFRREPS